MFGVRSPPFHMSRCPTLPPMAFNLISKPWRHSHLRSGSGESLGQLTGQNVANIFPFPFIQWEESWNGYLFHIMSYHVGEGEGQVWAKTPQNFLPFWVWLSWFGCSVGCCRPLTHFQSTLLFTWCFQEGNKGLELPVLTSCWHHLRNKFLNGHGIFTKTGYTLVQKSNFNKCQKISIIIYRNFSCHTANKVRLDYIKKLL